MIRVMLAAILGALVMVLVQTVSADAHWKPGTKHNVEHALYAGFCGNATARCGRGVEAVRVAKCESRLWPYATNGRHWGVLQVSDHWRRTVPGWAWNPWAQARHAARVHRLVGWSHWSCAYLVGVL